jgi:hypothetical protein
MIQCGDDTQKQGIGRRTISAKRAELHNLTNLSFGKVFAIQKGSKIQKFRLFLVISF